MERDVTYHDSKMTEVLPPEGELVFDLEKLAATMGEVAMAAPEIGLPTRPAKVSTGSSPGSENGLHAIGQGRSHRACRLRILELWRSRRLERGARRWDDAGLKYTADVT